MARLTNKQLEVLANSIVDKLEEEFNEKRKNYKESQEYKNKLKKLQEDPTYKKMENLIWAIDEAERVRVSKVTEAKELYKKLHNTTYPPYPSTEYIRMLEREHLNEPKYFDREKMMTKIQAAILLGDSTDAKEIFEKLIEKYGKEGTNPEIFSK